MPAVKKVGFVDGRVSHIVIRGGMCDIIFLNLGMEGRIFLQLSLKQYDGRVWTGVMWLRTGASDGLL
jgi:hypothetical protein